MLAYSRLLAGKLALLLSRKKFQVFFIALLLMFLSSVALQQRTQMLFTKFDPLHLEAQKLLQKQLQLDTEHNLTQLSLNNDLQLKDTEVKQPETNQQNLLDIDSHNILDSPQLSAVQQWPHGIRYAP